MEKGITLDLLQCLDHIGASSSVGELVVLFSRPEVCSAGDVLWACSGGCFITAMAPSESRLQVVSLHIEQHEVFELF